MRRTLSPVFVIGVLIFAAFTVTDRFITHIPDIAAIPILLLSIALIIADCLRKKIK